MPTATSPGRVLLIGLDSADAELVERWCEAGELPALQGLRERGTWARIETTASALHVSAWPTLYTGTSPGEHGLYHAYQIRAGEQKIHRTRAEECAREPFWRTLDEAGVPCIVLDAFLDRPLAGFRGVQVLEYGTWTWFTEPGASPAGLWSTIVRRFGRYPAAEHTKIHGRPEPARFGERLVAGAEVKGALARWLVEEHPWRLAFVSFGEPHPAGHYLWQTHDRSYPAGSAAPEGADLVLDVYRAVDRALAGILELVGEGDTVLVVSGDGMGPNHAAPHLLPELLHRLDLYHAADVGRASREPERPKKSFAGSLRALVPAGLRRTVSRCLPAAVQHRLSMSWVNADVDWTRSKAFCIPNANEGYVRLNLAGREPEGIVAQGAERDELMALLHAELASVVEPARGTRASSALLEGAALFGGEHEADLPDLVLTWNPEARVLGELESPRCGRVAGAPGHATAPFYTGNHRPAAFLLASGPGIPHGARLDAGHVLDVAPTVLALLGVPRPAHMRGRILREILDGSAASLSG